MIENNSTESDYVLLFGKIYTLDKYNHIYSSIAIKKNKIIFIGNNINARNYIGPKTKVINLKGKMVLPSFSYCHMYPLGNSFIESLGVNLSKVYNPNKDSKEMIDEYLNETLQFSINNPDVKIIYGYGWHPYAFTELESINGPKKERLDNLNIDKPIVLFSYDNHTAWLNSKAFEAFNITIHTKFIDEDTPCKNVIKNNNILWGTLKEDALLFIEPPKYTDEQYINNFLKFQSKMHSYGITSIASIYTDYFFCSIPLHIYKKLIHDNKLQLRIAYSESIHPHITKNGQHITVQEQILNLLNKKNETASLSPYFKVVGGKIFIDGVVNTRTAYLRSPYRKQNLIDNYNNIVNSKDTYGCNLWENNIDNLKFAINELNNHEFQIYFHSIGNGATNFLLDILESLSRYNQCNCRDILTCLQVINPSDIKRIKHCKIIISLQPFYNINSPITEHKTLEDISSYEYPLNSLLEEKVIISGSSDYPISPLVNPLIEIQESVTRNFFNEDELIFDKIHSIDNIRYLSNQNKKVSIMDMIRIFTKNSAYANFMNEEIGSLEVNKNADLIVLDKNLLDTDPIDFDKVKILMTFFDGKIVYSENNSIL